MTKFEQLVDWATHEGWRYCQGGKQCGNKMILKYDMFLYAVLLKHILRMPQCGQ